VGHTDIGQFPEPGVHSIHRGPTGKVPLYGSADPISPVLGARGDLNTSSVAGDLDEVGDGQRLTIERHDFRRHAGNIKGGCPTKRGRVDWHTGSGVEECRPATEVSEGGFATALVLPFTSFVNPAL
jgi:hypothetical protein